MSDLHLQFRLGISTISGIVEEVCKLIWNILQSEHMPIPDTAKWLSIAHGFQNKENFPNCRSSRWETHQNHQASAKWIYVLPLQEFLFNCSDGNL